MTMTEKIELRYTRIPPEGSQLPKRVVVEVWKIVQDEEAMTEERIESKIYIPEDVHS